LLPSVLAAGTTHLQPLLAVQAVASSPLQAVEAAAAAGFLAVLSPVVFLEPEPLFAGTSLVTQVSADCALFAVAGAAGLGC
jgi:hypothetical protein